VVSKSRTRRKRNTPEEQPLELTLGGYLSWEVFESTTRRKRNTPEE